MFQAPRFPAYVRYKYSNCTPYTGTLAQDQGYRAIIKRKRVYRSILSTTLPSRPLEIYTKSSSEKGLSSVTTLIVGSKTAILIDPPLLIPDADATVEWIRSIICHKLSAVLVTHHHPDHYFSANPGLDAFPSAQLYAAPYVCAGIDREYDENIVFWPMMFGKDVPERPRKPTPFSFSLVTLDGDIESPYCFLDHCRAIAWIIRSSGCRGRKLLFAEMQSTLGVRMCGKACLIAASVLQNCVFVDHLLTMTIHRVEEVETPALLNAWQKTLDLIEALAPTRVIAGHLEAGWVLDAKADIDHTRKYLDLLGEKVTFAKKKPTDGELFNTFKQAFPQAEKNLGFFPGNSSNKFGEGGKVWEENQHHNVGTRTLDGLEGYIRK